MARRRDTGSNPDSDRRQLSLDGYFALPRPPQPLPGSHQFALQLRNILTRALKECPLSRSQVAARMTDLMYGDAGDGEVTKVQLDTWTRSDPSWRFPLEALPAFIEATGAVWLLDVLAEKCGCRILVGEQALLAQLGAVILERKRLGELEASIKRSVPDDVIARLLNQGGEP